MKVHNPVTDKSGKKKLALTAKGFSDGDAWGSSCYRTISGEEALLQIKTSNKISSNFGIVHLHCMKDKERSEYSYNKVGNINELYKISQDKNTKVLRIKCNACGREWFNTGAFSQEKVATEI